MINKQTVLVLGAGASTNYGFPTGRELKNRILDQNNWHKHAGLFGHWADEVGWFTEAFRGSGIYSVDKFLSYNSKFEAIGKVAIASVLIQCESLEYLVPQPGELDPWYQYLWNCLLTDKENFKKNKLTIVTFNYDRSLEQYLFQTIRNTFGVTEDEARILLNCIPIIHVYGDLGKLGERSTKKGSRPYHHPADDLAFAEEIGIAKERLRIVGQRTESDVQLSTLHSIITSAERICFLGFGFDESNIELLPVKQLHDNDKIEIYASTKGLQGKEVSSVRNRLGAYLSHSDDCCVNFLRSHGVLI